MRQFSTEAAQRAEEPPVVHNVPLDLNTATADELYQSPMANKLRERYPGIKIVRVPRAVFGLDFDRDIVSAEEKLMSQYGFLKEEVAFVMRYNPKFILVDHQKNVGMKTLQAFFVNEKGFETEAVRTLVVRYPYILSKTREELNTFFEIIKGQGLTEEETMRALLDCPKLISRKDLPKQIKEMQFLFRLYHGVNEQEVTSIFRSFPYLYLCETNKLQKFLGEFRKYRMTKEQIIKLCSHSGGILASKVSNFIGLFDLLKQRHNIKASEVVQIIDAFPEFVFQNKKDLLRRKIELIQNNSKNLSPTYIRHLIRRHPDVFLK